MIISACIIVKDDSEVESLKRAVDSIKDYVDEVIITANGEKVQKIEDYCTSNEKIAYFYHKWTKDFAEQRNFCASKIRSDADFYIWIDADDVLVGGELLRDIAIRAKKQNLDAVFFTYWYSCLFKGKESAETVEKVELAQTRERLLKPGSTTWKKRLHETPVPVEGIDYKYTHVEYSKENPIVWLHLGVNRALPMDKQKAKQERNRELLELQLEDERKEGDADPRTLLYLMKIYSDSEDEKLLKENLKMGEEYLIKSGWDAERAACCALIATSFDKLGADEKAKDFLFQSIKEYPYDPVLYLYLSRACYNLGQYNEMKHWLEMGLNLDNKNSASSLTNLLELKALSSELMMKYYFNAERNVRKAYKAMKLLYKELPNEENKKTLDYLEKLKDLDEASEDAHKLMLYYEKQNNDNGVVDVYKSMPPKMQNLPFASHMYNKHKEPKIWEEDEICYYASFGSPHFERWGPENLKKGIGGSETAVIQLSKEWAKKGYRVTVYCDCGEQEGYHDGVLYLQYFRFNPRDLFNIFINWRSNHLAGIIKAKKFIIDLHDLFNEIQFRNYERYDKLFVKSDYHRGLASIIPDDKVEVISNGQN